MRNTEEIQESTIKGAFQDIADIGRWGGYGGAQSGRRLCYIDLSNPKIAEWVSTRLIAIIKSEGDDVLKIKSSNEGAGCAEGI